MPRERALIRQLHIKLDGADLDTRYMDDLYRAEVDSHLYLPDMCVLSLHDPRTEVVNDGPFALGAALEVGVSDEQGRGAQTLFEGEITSLEPHFDEGMAARLIVRAYDRSHRLHRGAQTRSYVRMSDSDIAQAIANDAGLRADVDSSSPTHEHVYQDGQTHMEFLRERARRIGYDLYVRERTLCFKRGGQAGGSPIQLEWGEQLLSFYPIASLGEQVSETVVKSWDSGTKREIVGRATTSQAAARIGADASGSQMAEDAFGAAAELAVRSTARTQDEADVLAQSLLDARSASFVQAEGVCYGQAALKAGCEVEISALGRLFNGRYAVTSATHIWDTEQDYVTRFRVSGRRADTLRELLAPEPAPARQWHAMIGVVTNIQDPDDLARVKVKFPWLDADLESDWARVVAPGAGAQRGIYWLPEVNDEVLVLFEQGDMARPLVVGGLWNGSDAPSIPASQAIANGSVVQRVLVSRQGHQLVFSEENSAFVRLQSAAGHVLLFDDDADKIEIKTPGGVTITLNNASNALEIKSPGEIKIEASSNLSIKASANMNIEASGQMTIKGAIIQLNP
jgi:phage protein D/phage baseplate assembly protein gpV